MITHRPAATAPDKSTSRDLHQKGVLQPTKPSNAAMDGIVKAADASNSFAFEAVAKAIRNAVDKAQR